MGTCIIIALVICTIWYMFCPERAPLPVLLIGNAVFYVFALTFIRWILGGIWRGVTWVVGF